MSQTGILILHPTKVNGRSLKVNDFLELAEPEARALVNGGRAKYADGRPADKPMVDGHGRSVRYFNT